MKLRNATIVLLSIATLAVACIDLSAPKGPASISGVRLPAAFVVRGDVMRDSAGTPAMPTVDQFDAAGHVFGGVAALFIITDSAPVAHFDASGGELVGDKLGDVHFIGQIGNLQTPSVTVHVTVAPTTLVAGTVAKDTLRPPLTQDTTVGVDVATIPVVVRGIGDTVVQGVVVHYALTRTLASNSSTHDAVVLFDQSGNALSTDTTDVAGNAARIQLKVRSAFLADVQVATGQKIDSVIVQASVTYRGAALTGSPLTFVYYVLGTIAP